MLIIIVFLEKYNLCKTTGQSACFASGNPNHGKIQFYLSRNRCNKYPKKVSKFFIMAIPEIQNEDIKKLYLM